MSLLASQKRIKALRQRLMRLDYVCSGNLRRRYAACGTENCRCKAQPPKFHGPYYYWSRLLNGKVIQKVLSPQEARIVAKAIENYRMARQLLKQWESETDKIIASRRTKLKAAASS